MLDWIQVDFAGSKTIDEISVFSLHDNYTVENTPTETQTFTLYGLLNFNVEYWNGSSWVTVPGGSVTANNKVWRKFTFSPITTSKIRVYITAVPDAWSRVVEIQAFGISANDQRVQWLISDHLGTPRMVLDETGNLANMKRHDYLPFGEELFAPTSGRSAAQGYSGGDAVRQQFTSKERDVETGLDYFGARYYGSVQGRFTRPDDFLNDTDPVDPASWNLYAYVRNNPLRYIDPTGEKIYVGDITNADDRDELLRRANYTYGCQSCVTVDQDGFLAVDTTGLSQDVLKATAFLTDAINSNDASKLFSVEVTNNNSDVAFGDSQAGMAGVQLPGNNFRTSAIRIRLDFGDDKRVTGDKAANEVFLNLVFAHEVKHFFPNYIQDPADARKTGPVVDAINEIQQARGLLLRAEYGATKRGEFVSLNFGTAKRDRSGNIVRNKAGGIEVNKTNKVITWVKRTVGGKGIN
jgi:RHS repeat-associated protein